MHKKVYINTERTSNEAFSAIVTDGNKQCEVVFAGKSIESMPVSHKNETAYQILADFFDVKFIFDDAIPQISFYPVPRLFIFATDNIGGVFASINNNLFLDEKNAPIYYIDKKQKYFNIADNMKEFLELLVFYPKWKEKLYNIEAADEEQTEISHEQKLLIDIFNLLKPKEDYLILAKKSLEIKLYNSFSEAEKIHDFLEINFH